MPHHTHSHTTDTTPHTYTHTTDTTSHTTSHGDTDRERRQRETREGKTRRNVVFLFLKSMFFVFLDFFLIFCFFTGSGFGLQMQIWASLDFFITDTDLDFSGINSGMISVSMAL